MKSRNFKKFKDRMGQANHFLITTLIGLDAVKNGAKKPESFDAAWNPQNVEASVVRSKMFVINAALSWAVDNLDMYLRTCNREPKLYSAEESKQIAETKHSVYNKFKCVIDNHNIFSESQKAFVDLLICWRNNMIHFGAENELLDNTTKYFKHISDEDVIKTKYHFNAESMLVRFNKGESPTFKEIATMISMTIHFIEALDDELITHIDQQNYLRGVLHYEYRNNSDVLEDLFGFQNTPFEKRAKKIKQFLISRGVVDSFYNSEGLDFIDKISNMNSKELIEYIKLTS